jgi:phosphohistidine phosphatase
MKQHWVSQLEVSLFRNLYLAGAKAYVEALELVPDDTPTAMLVAHNPGLESLVSSIAGEDIAFPTAAVAVIAANVNSFQSAYRSLHLWEIKTILRPKEIGFQFDDD